MIKITMLKNYRTLKENEVFILDKNINLIVGDNGTGKSTLLSLLRSELIRNNKLKTGILYMKNVIKNHQEICKIEGFDNYEKFYDFDTETDSGKGLAMSDMNLFLETDGLAVGQKSSGEGQLYQMAKLVKHISKTSNNLILIDELDRGWSISNRRKFINVLNKFIKKDDMLLIVSHNEFLLNHVDSVLDMGRKEWIRPQEYFVDINNLKLNLIKQLFKLKDIDDNMNSLFISICTIDEKRGSIFTFYNYLFKTVLDDKYLKYREKEFKKIIDLLLNGNIFTIFE